MRNLSYIFFVLIFALNGCVKPKLSEDEIRLERYFTEKLKINRSDYKDYYLVVISGNCGSCTEKTINFLKQMGNVNNKRFVDFKKLVIVPENNAYVIDSVKNTDIRFIVEEGHELEKFGVKFPKNKFFEFKDDKLVYKDWLYLDNVDTVAKKYGIIL